MTAQLERNLVVYGWYQIVARAYFWLPTVVLFFLDRFGLAVALRLAGVYYLAVVVLEVPSGWFSDRVGRVAVLRAGAWAWVASYLVFVTLGAHAGAAVVAQVLLATGFACRSGTDVSLHYDTLEALGRVAAFERREARCTRNGFAMTAVSAALGGLLAAVDLRLPFAAAAVAAVVQLWLVARLSEPPSGGRAIRGGQLGRSWVGYLRHPLLAWLFVAVIVKVTLEHLTLELSQPYLVAVLDDGLTGATRGGSTRGAPILSGMLLAVTSLVGALGVGRSLWLRTRLGLTATLVALASIQTAIVVVMALVVHLVVVPLLALRSVQTAAAPVLVAAATAPLLERHHRATFLSLASLAGRLGYGITLLSLSRIDDLDDVTSTAALLAVGLLAILAISARGLLSRSADRPARRSTT